MEGNKKNAYFPLFIDLANKKVVVVGAGIIGTRRIQILSEFPCHITVIAKEVSEEVKQLQDEQRIEVIERGIREEDLEDAFLIIAATNVQEINDWIITQSKKARFVNHVGDKEQSNFYFPGIVKDENYVIGITASGMDHKGAKKATDFIRRIWRERFQN
ncbi:MAG: bifunctional precorrin-2 dehydrogenase/sirohydrochlorin ferrochelatase [Eubacteriales bacterium]